MSKHQILPFSCSESHNPGIENPKYHENFNKLVSLRSTCSLQSHSSILIPYSTLKLIKSEKVRVDNWLSWVVARKVRCNVVTEVLTNCFPAGSGAWVWQCSHLGYSYERAGQTTHTQLCCSCRYPAWSVLSWSLLLVLTLSFLSSLSSNSQSI